MDSKKEQHLTIAGLIIAVFNIFHLVSCSDMMLRTLIANWICNVDGESDDEKDERDGDEEILITEQGKDPDFVPCVLFFFSKVIFAKHLSIPNL